MSPTPIDKLAQDSSDAQVQAAISECIQMEIHNGREQDQAAGMCYSMARKKTGKMLGKEETNA